MITLILIILLLVISLIFLLYLYNTKEVNDVVIDKYKQELDESYSEIRALRRELIESKSSSLKL